MKKAGSGSRSIPFDLTIQANTGKQYVSFLKTYLHRAHQLLNPALSELSLALVGDTRMARLHQQFMDIPGTTDVLTFPLDTDAKNRVTSGEVIICVPEAVRQSRARQIRTQHELLLYAVHGMLHLCGFDDKTKVAFRQMHRKENELLIRLGLGPVFGRIEPGDAHRKPMGTPARPANRSLGQRTGENRRRRSRALNERVGV